MKRTTIDDDIETMVRHLIEVHLADDVRDAALDWLEKLANAYKDMQELGLVEDK
jgi:hypothetical protein